MNSRQIFIHILIRIAILLLVTGTVFLIWYLSFDPHKYCDGDQHRHVDGGLGLFIVLFMVVLMYYGGLLIETIYLFIKKNKKTAFANLGILTVLSFIIALFIFGIS